MTNANKTYEPEALVGGTITDFDFFSDETGDWPAFTVRLASGELVLVEASRDPEGNGPGHLFVTDVGRLA